MCGIAGILNSKPRIFDYTTFCVLGINNDSRGGDSCGVFIDGKYEVFAEKDKKLFSQVFKESNVLNEFRGKECSIALVHDRKASIGKIAPETAQPVILTDKAGNVRFVMIHNGTIHNYEDLAKKYIPETDIKGMTDSQVMARIFYYKGYDALAEYNGGSVFLIVDYRQPEPLKLVFRGASKKYESAKEPEEERPFYFIQNDDEFVFSSIDKYLEALRPDETVYTIEDNMLIKIGEGEISNVKAYDRSKCCQTKKYSGTTVVTTSNYYGGAYHHSSYGSDYYQGGGYRGNSGASHSSAGTNGTMTNGSGAASMKPSFLRLNKSKNLYYIDSERTIPCHGKYNITEYGRVITGDKETSKSSYPAMEIWFYNGIALRSGEYYRFIEFACKKYKGSNEEFFNKFQNMIRFISLDRLYPVNGVFQEATGLNSYRPFSGEFQMLGDSWIQEYDNGLTSKSRNIKEYSAPFKKLKDKGGVNISKLYKKCKSLMK